MYVLRNNGRIEGRMNGTSKGCVCVHFYAFVCTYVCVCAITEELKETLTEELKHVCALYAFVCTSVSVFAIKEELKEELT